MSSPFEEITLKDGTVTHDRRLDRLIEFDPRSRDYPITAVIDKTRPRSYSWAAGQVTDQGAEGACVGHGWTGELTARPVPVRVPAPATFATALYHDIQHLDPWQGCHQGPACPVQPNPKKYDGTSVLTGAQVLAQRGFITEFRWAFGLSDLILALGYQGPAVLGIPWYESMYDAPGGVVSISGSKVGGHCILARGVSLRTKTVLLRNSWGPDWGIGGDARISFTDLERLLHEDGEACIPVRTAKITV